MKTLEELGISPTPWTNVIDTDNPFKWNSVWDSRNGMILSGGYTQSVPDATLIAAAPELYEELRQEMERRYCVECKHAVWTKPLRRRASPLTRTGRKRLRRRTADNGRSRTVYR